MGIDAKVFLTKAEEIAAEEPGYQKGHDGSDHMCDCIGLIIGAIRRAGGQWRGLHGSNYAARKETEKLVHVKSAADLVPGMVIYKAYEPGVGGYALPARYEPGGDYYTGDMRDYYHVGVVISTSPLRIRHMTTPRPKMDKELGKWAWAGKLKKLAYGGSGVKVTYKAKVIGGALNLRKEPSSSADRITQIPDGSTVTVTEEEPSWCRVEYDGKTGWCMSMFLAEIKPEPDGGETITVSKAQLEQIYDTIGDMLGLRG